MKKVIITIATLSLMWMSNNGANAQSIVTTVAGGGGSTAFSGNGGPATQAHFITPAGLAIDANGNIYVSDASTNCVRKISPLGTITTIAGNGKVGYLGDSVAATLAELSSPRDIAIDATGNIYIADGGNNLIRKVNSAGIISTIAGTPYYSGYSGDGGPATAAGLNSPYGVTTDALGNLYIADAGNNLIRMVNTAGIISTFAGDTLGYSTYSTAGYSGDGGPATAAKLSRPYGVSADASGNIYIADYGNYVVRKVNSAGVIATIAGIQSSPLSYGGDGGPATAAILGYPYGIALDAGGNIYIADGYSNLIRKINTAGIISTIAGDTVGVSTQNNNGYSGDGGLATEAKLNNPYSVIPDALGNIYIADYSNGVIRQVSAAGYIATIAGTGPYHPYAGDGGVATAATLSSAAGVAKDPLGNIYIADVGNNAIRKVNSAGIITTIAGLDSAGIGRAGYSGDGGPATAAKLNNPWGVSADAAGNIYIADVGNNVIRKVNSAGIITTIAGLDSAGIGRAGYSGDVGSATAAKLNSPIAVSADAAGNIYIADAGNNVIRKVNSIGIISTVAGFDSAGVGQAGYSGDGGTATAAKLNFPYGVSADAAGNIYIADTYNSVIRMVNSAGIISTIAGNATLWGYSGDGSPATAASLSFPYGVVTDISGNIYIADGFNNVIRVVNSAGIINTIAGNSMAAYTGDGGTALQATFFNPFGLAYNAYDNSLYVGDYSNSAVRKISCLNMPLMSIQGRNHVCQHDTVLLTAQGSGPYYQWSTGATGHSIAIIAINSSQTYSVGSPVGFGCNNVADFTVSVLIPPIPEICEVSTDSITNKYNIVYWNKIYPKVDSFLVYRYDAITTNYLRIGAVSKDSLSEFKDTAYSIGGPNGGNPQYSSWRYKLAILDSCGNISAQSHYHQTMFLQQNGSNFSWNAYTIETGLSNPVSGYQFLRDDSSTGAWHVLTNTSSNSTTDPNYSNFPNGNWRIDATGFSCTPTLRLAGGGNNSPDATRVKSHSNDARRAGNGIETFSTQHSTFQVYPNPASNTINIVSSDITAKTLVNLYDATGRLVLQQTATGYSSTIIDVQNIQAGMYFIEVGGIRKTIAIAK